MKDIALYETGNGGDFFLNNGDLSSVEILIQQVYISLFGGNVEDSTKGNEIEGQKRFDWWANSLIFKNEITRQFNSETERVLNKAVLNSSGRNEIEQAVENDLETLSKIVDFTVKVLIQSEKKVLIIVALKQIKNKEDKVLQFLWDSAKKEVIIQKII